MRVAAFTVAMRLSPASVARRHAMHQTVLQALTKHNRPLAGCDEAGAGALAGPLVAAAVLIDPSVPDSRLPLHPALDDSKRLSPAQRQRIYHHLRRHPALTITHHIVSPQQVDQLNVLQARLHAMSVAVQSLPSSPHLLFVDGHLPLPHLKCDQRPVVRGDASLSIVAAAGIVAKVIRDHIMHQYARQYPLYGFDRHVGYPTPEHRRALTLHGPCQIHRQSFKPVRIAAHSS